LSLKEFIIPAIDIKNGKAVRLYKGNPKSVTVYGNNPVDTAKIWEEKGAKQLHIVDLDGAFEGKPKNFKIVEQIAKSISIPIQFGGGLRDFESIKTMFDIGVQRVIVGSMAYKNREETEKAISFFPQKIIIGIDAKDGKVAVKGWLEKTEYSPLEFALEYDELDIWGFLYTDVNRDGALVGANVEATKQLAGNLKHPVIASGGISNLKDVEKLYKIKECGIYGVIVGKALYEGKIELEKIK